MIPGKYFFSLEGDIAGRISKNCFRTITFDWSVDLRSVGHSSQKLSSETDLCIFSLLYKNCLPGIV